MKTKTTVTAAVITLLTPTTVLADFYQGAGLPKEKNWQEHINLDVGENLGVTAITKYVPADGHTVSVLAVGATNGKLNPLGFAQGYRFDAPFENGNYIGVLPMIQGSVGTESITLAPTLYGTAIVGKWTFDHRMHTPMTVTYQGDFSFDGVVTGATVGYQVRDPLRVGPDVQMNVFARDSLTLGAMLRYDPPGANGNHWMQVGMSSTLEGNVRTQLQLRINL
jgi:hypothetical protein